MGRFSYLRVHRHNLVPVERLSKRHLLVCCSKCKQHVLLTGEPDQLVGEARDELIREHAETGIAVDVPESASRPMPTRANPQTPPNMPTGPRLETFFEHRLPKSSKELLMQENLLATYHRIIRYAVAGALLGVVGVALSVWSLCRGGG